jgi:multiple sugar transport system ATP-binding protein
VTEAARLLEIEDELDRKPRALSGGQRQRVAMGHRVAVLRDARLQQVDTPRNLYERPAYVYGVLAGNAAGTKPWVVRCDGRDAPHIGDRVGVTVRAAEGTPVRWQHRPAPPLSDAMGPR